MVLAFTAQLTHLLCRTKRFDYTIFVLIALRPRLSTLAARRSTRAFTSDGYVIAHALFARDTGTVYAAEILFARTVLVLGALRDFRVSAERESNE